MKCSTICSKGFRQPFKLLRTSNALVHRPFVQNADSAVIFINPCPEISILKAFRKVPLLEPEHQQKANFQRQLFAFNQRLRPGYMDCRGSPEKFVVKKKPKLSKVTWKNLEVTRDLFVIILWWKSFPGLARGNSWCLWTWKSKSEITKIPVQTSFLVAWKTPPGFTLPCRSNLYLKTCRLPIIGLKCASIKIHQVL